MVWNEKRQRFDWREVRRYSYRRDEYDPILVKVTGLYSVYCGQGWEPGSRQSRDSSRLSDDPTSWSGTTRLRWSRPGARFKRQAWSDIWCRPRLCRGPGERRRPFGRLLSLSAADIHRGGPCRCPGRRITGPLTRGVGAPRTQRGVAVGDLLDAVLCRDEGWMALRRHKRPQLHVVS